MFAESGETKQCSMCCKLKALSEFNRKSKTRLQNRCRACNREYLKEHYQSNLEYYREKAARNGLMRRQARFRLVHEYLSQHPCVDRDETDPIVLQFDHVRGNKVESISMLVRASAPMDKIIDEIAKCDVRCANCHARRTAKQFDWYVCLQRVPSEKAPSLKAAKKLRGEGSNLYRTAPKADVLPLDHPGSGPKHT